MLYEQLGTQLVARHGSWNSPAWDPDGHGEHSVQAHVHTLEHYVDIGGTALGAFASQQLVGIGVVVPHLRPEHRAARIPSRQRAVPCDGHRQASDRAARADRPQRRVTPTSSSLQRHRRTPSASTSARLPAHGGTVRRAARARARRRTHAQGALTVRTAPVASLESAAERVPENTGDNTRPTRPGSPNTRVIGRRMTCRRVRLDPACHQALSEPEGRGDLRSPGSMALPRR